MKRRRSISREAKLKALGRMEAGERASKVAQELGVGRKLLYAWRARVRQGGAEALNAWGRPRKGQSKGSSATGTARDALDTAKRRIAELERKIGQQQVDLDFFRRALQHVQETRAVTGKRGGKVSTRSSKR